MQSSQHELRSEFPTKDYSNNRSPLFSVLFFSLSLFLKQFLHVSVEIIPDLGSSLKTTLAGVWVILEDEVQSLSLSPSLSISLSLSPSLSLVPARACVRVRAHARVCVAYFCVHVYM